MKISLLQKSFFILIGTILLTSCATIPKGATAVQPFESERYLGKWYEIARMDFKFEENLNNTTATYSLNENGTIKVENRGYNYVAKEWKESTGKAKFVGAPTIANLKVSFFGPFYAGYNVIAIDEQYQYALVVGKDQDYMWILSREIVFPNDVKEEYLNIAKELGFKTDELVWVEHGKTEEAKINFQNKGHKLVHEMVQKVGDYDKLRSLKDVRYTYTYQSSDGKKDVSTEKYIFDGELSYGSYDVHERSYLDMPGRVEQSYDGAEYWLKHKGEIIEDSEALKRVAFLRPTNFYWFTMMQKLLDPTVNFEHLGEKRIDENDYDIVKITFKSEGDMPTDIYQLYINQDTKLVDQFLFTVADYGKMEIPFLMKMQYENINGILVPNKRKYKSSTWDAAVSDKPWTNVIWADIKFNNGFTVADFQK